MSTTPMDNVVAFRTDDAKLVDAARAGDRDAMDSLYRRHVHRVEGLAWRLAPHPADADDILQDAFIQAFTQLSRLDDASAFGPWLTTIVVRTAYRRLRRIRLRRRLGLRPMGDLDLEHVIGIHTPPDVSAELRDIYSAIEKLPAQERVALVLQRVEGYTISEIAGHMNLSTATVKRRLKKATDAVTRYAERRG